MNESDSIKASASVAGVKTKRKGNYPTTHGRRYTREYLAWARMIQRTSNPKYIQWRDYGGRGITCCDQWKNFEGFFADMGPCPPKLSLDRINDNGNYEPGNCRWATRTEQMRNTRRSVYLTLDGETLIQRDWARRLGIAESSLFKRLKRWTLRDALTTPPLR